MHGYAVVFCLIGQVFWLGGLPQGLFLCRSGHSICLGLEQRCVVVVRGPLLVRRHLLGEDICQDAPYQEATILRSLAETLQPRAAKGAA